MTSVFDAMKTSIVMVALESWIWTAYSVPWPVPWASQCQEPLGALAGLLIAGGRLRPALDLLDARILAKRSGLDRSLQTPLTPPPPHPSVSQRLLSYITTGWTGGSRLPYMGPAARPLPLSSASRTGHLFWSAFRT